ncbi:hypothetical protein QTP88_024465 [Uroleucon formosanum]
MEEDRHKLKRVYMSGADKRKLAKEKDKKNTKIISKTRRMTEFFITQPNTTSSSEVIKTYISLFMYKGPPQYIPPRGHHIPKSAPA